MYIHIDCIGNSRVFWFIRVNKQMSLEFIWHQLATCGFIFVCLCAICIEFLVIFFFVSFCCIWTIRMIVPMIFGSFTIDSICARIKMNKLWICRIVFVFFFHSRLGVQFSETFMLFTFTWLIEKKLNSDIFRKLDFVGILKSCFV